MINRLRCWPDHYPELCPPNNAGHVSGRVFRFTNRTNPKSKDFLSYYDLKPGEEWGRSECNARGLSVYTTEQDCIAAADAVPALRRKHLCVAELPSHAGVIADTPSKNTENHKTLWSLFTAEELSALFTPIESLRMANV